MSRVRICKPCILGSAQMPSGVPWVFRTQSKVATSNCKDSWCGNSNTCPKRMQKSNPTSSALCLLHRLRCLRTPCTRWLGLCRCRGFRLRSCLCLRRLGRLGVLDRPGIAEALTGGCLVELTGLTLLTLLMIWYDQVPVLDLTTRLFSATSVLVASAHSFRISFWTSGLPSGYRNLLFHDFGYKCVWTSFHCLDLKECC